MSSSAWHDEAVQCFENEGLSYQEIADRFGRTRATVVKLMKLRKAKRRVPLERRGGRLRSDQIPPVSDVHKKIGIALNLHRTIELDLSLTELGNRMAGKSVLLVKKMELGQHDFSLTELWQIADMLGTSVAELISPPVSRIYAEDRQQQTKNL